jgi:folate-dependent phosphoribosylglycinamide formyltransferase PurN
MQTIAILSTKNDPLLIHLINRIKKLKNLKFIILFADNSLSNSKKNFRIFKERTGNYFKTKQKISKVDMQKMSFRSHNSIKLKKFLLKNKIKYLYNGGTPNKIQKKILNAVKGIINIHPGLFPKYRGCTNIEWALKNKEPLGLTAHLMDEKYDNGPIIKTKILKFKKEKIRDYKDIRIKAYLEQINLAEHIFSLIAKNKIKLKKNIIKKNNFFPIIPNKILKIVKNDIKKGKITFNNKNLI